MTREQPPSIKGRLTFVIDFLKISESVVSSIAVALTGFALLSCMLYALALILGGTESWRFLVIGFFVVSFAVRIILKATNEERLRDLKRNGAFESALLAATIIKDCLSVLVLFRLALYAVVLVGSKGAGESWTTLWEVVRHLFKE